MPGHFAVFKVYLVMPCLERELFDVVAERGRYSEPEAFDFLRQLVGGLEVAHALGLAHHDMSLENLMTDAAGRAVIIDWGMVVKVPVTPGGTVVKLAPAATWPCRCGKVGATFSFLMWVHD
jgi:serine/threonine protein kinase